MNEALRTLHSTQDEKDPRKHRVNVCVVCDCVIIGTHPVNLMSVDALLVHQERLGAESYRKYYGRLHKELEQQYSLSDLPGMLVSLRSRKNEKGYVVCSCCYGSMRPSMAK